MAKKVLMQFSILKSCDTCSKILLDDDVYNGAITTTGNCNHHNKKVNLTEDCEDWSLCSNLINEIFWIEKETHESH